MTTATTTTGPSARRESAPAPLSLAVVAMSMVLAAITTATSLIGLFAQWAYAAETENWRLQAQAQDLGNLLAVAVLTVATPAARRGSLRARALWTGTCLYLSYAFVIYAMSLHFGPLFLAYVAGLGLSSFCLLFTLPAAPLTVAPPRRRVRLAATVLITIGVGFALLWLSSIGSGLASGQLPPELVAAGLVANPVHVLDLAVVLPGMVAVAIRSLRGSGRARALLAPWLTFSGLMGASVVAALMLAGGPVGVVAAVVTVTVVSVGTLVLVLRPPYVATAA